MKKILKTIQPISLKFDMRNVWMTDEVVPKPDFRKIRYLLLGVEDLVPFIGAKNCSHNEHLSATMQKAYYKVQVRSKTVIHCLCYTHLLIYLTAVSYTHLDVYKRQHLYNAYCLIKAQTEILYYKSKIN